MPTPTAQSRINARIDEFFADLQSLIQQAVQEAAANALGDVGTAPRRRRKKAGKRKAAKRAGRKRGKRIRRTAKDLDTIATRVLAHVKAKPG